MCGRKCEWDEQERRESLWLWGGTGDCVQFCTEEGDRQVSAFMDNYSERSCKGRYIFASIISSILVRELYFITVGTRMRDRMDVKLRLTINFKNLERIFMFKLPKKVESLFFPYKLISSQKLI